MRRLDTPGCYRAVRWIVLGMLALPLIALGCFALEGIRVERHFRAGEAAFRREIEQERLVGTSRAHVLGFLRRKGLEITIHIRSAGTDHPTEWVLQHKAIENQPLFRINTPGVSCGSMLFDFCFSEVEFRFDRHDRLMSYRFFHRAAIVL